MPVLWTLREGCAFANGDFPSTTDTFIDAEGCVLVATLCHFQSPGERYAALSRDDSLARSIQLSGNEKGKKYRGKKFITVGEATLTNLRGGVDRFV